MLSIFFCNKTTFLIFSLLLTQQELVDDDDELWETHCIQEFKNKKPSEEETWRELYIRLKYERELKLKSITAHINRNQQKQTPGNNQKTVCIILTFKVCNFHQ